MDSIVPSQPMDSIVNETTETDFNFTLLVNALGFSSQTVNTPSLTDHDNNNNNHKDNNSSTNNTNNTLYQIT